MRFDPLLAIYWVSHAFPHVQSPLSQGLLDDGISNGMINVLLKTGTDSENIFLTIVPKGNTFSTIG